MHPATKTVLNFLGNFALMMIAIGVVFRIIEVFPGVFWGITIITFTHLLPALLSNSDGESGTNKKITRGKEK